MESNWLPVVLPEILRSEGGYVNNPKDPGGETNMGITKATARANGYTGPMRQIPLSVVSSIYYKKFWNTPYYRGSDMFSGVDLSVVDFGVNSGPSRAGRYYKAALKPNDPVATIKALNKARLGFLRGLGTWATFGGGWGRRVATTEAKSVKMALAAQGKAPGEVSKGLDKEATSARGERTGAVVKGTGSAGTEVATQTNGAEGWDWSHILWVGAEVALAIAVVYFAYQIYIHHQRTQAYTAEAKA